MRQTINYNIHNIIRFQINRDEQSRIVDDINLKFSYFKTSDKTQPQITLNIGKFTPSNENCYVVDHKYFVKEGYVYCEDSEGHGKWKNEIIDLEGNNTIINFEGGVSGIQKYINRDFIAQNFLLRIIEYKLWGKGCFLHHSAAVGKDGYAFVLAGRGGTFKTSFCMNLVKSAGFEFIGDDSVIFRDNEVFCFPQSLAVLNFMYSRMSDENQWNMTNKIKFLTYLVRNRGKEMSCEIRTAGVSKLKSLFFVVRNNNDRFTCDKLGLDSAVRKFINNNEMENFIGLSGMGIRSAPFLKYMLAYSFVFPDNSFDYEQRELKNNLLELLKDHLPIFEVHIPEKLSSSTFENLRRLMDT